MKTPQHVRALKWVRLCERSPDFGEVVLAYTTIGPRLGIMGIDGRWRLFGLGIESHLLKTMNIEISHWMKIVPPTDKVDTEQVTDRDNMQ